MQHFRAYIFFKNIKQHNGGRGKRFSNFHFDFNKKVKRTPEFEIWDVDSLYQCTHIKYFCKCVITKKAMFQNIDF